VDIHKQSKKDKCKLNRKFYTLKKFTVASKKYILVRKINKIKTARLSGQAYTTGCDAIISILIWGDDNSKVE
jgi:hypothetical protein